MSLRLAGYAALFDTVDKGGDLIRPGAFRRAVAAGAARVPLLWQHEAARPIGRIEHLAEDRRGLRVIARLTPGAPGAEAAAALLRDGAIGGLSFGYRVRASQAAPAGRALTDVELVEISLVTFPMQPGARVHALADEEQDDGL
ncbi:HK97 family phage prohead protease [Sphingomonas morindae]|uniref:HK97 family phage prohead protease n=1 Tax=Sphingomonas morindae TaxID=1541170 RepID=A0ABY4X3K2_9SPHN|nr:HK97 family phage prohead protease [Sphingomonas morindae]USI71467.1 HK97 family phage prohead protease [Sphingomonas morindae]